MVDEHHRRERLEVIRELMDNLGLTFCEAARLYNGTALDMGDGVTATVTEKGRTLYDDRPFSVVQVNLPKK